MISSLSFLKIIDNFRTRYLNYVSYLGEKSKKDKKLMSMTGWRINIKVKKRVISNKKIYRNHKNRNNYRLTMKQIRQYRG